MPESCLATSYDLRLLLCHHCGAPIQTVPEGGLVACSYCASVHQLAPRKEKAEDFEAEAHTESPASASDDDAEFAERNRLEKLRAQLSSSAPQDFPPTEILRFVRRSTDPSALPECQKRWQQAVSDLANGKSVDAELYWLTGVLRTQFMLQGDSVRARAVDETAAELTRDPIFRTRLHTSLAQRACDSGDLEAAEAWLAPIDPKPTSLAVHTDLALARATIALIRGDWGLVLTYLGHSADEIPIAIMDDVQACMFRATAYERLGELGAAERALWEVVRNLSGKLFGPRKVRFHLRTQREGGLSQRTVALFFRNVALHRAQALAWFVLGSLVVAVFVYFLSA